MKNSAGLLIFFIPILYFTLFDQPGYIPSVKLLSLGLVLLIFGPWLGLKVWRRDPLRPTPFDYLFPLIIVLHVASAGLSLSFRLTFYSLWLLLLSILIFYLVLDQLKAGREDVLWKALFLVPTLVLQLALLEFFTWYLGLSWLPGFEVGWPEVEGWTFPPNPHRLGLALLTVPIAPPFSAYVAMFIPLALGLALSTRQLVVRLGITGFIFLSLIILILTFSRTGLITLATSMIIFALLAWFIRRSAPLKAGYRFGDLILQLRQLPQRGSFLPIVLIGTLFSFTAFLSHSYLINELFTNRDSSNQIRLSLIEAALLMWHDQPLLGVGPGLFGAFYRNYIPPNSFFLLSLSTHSFYFQLLAEEGIIGFTICVGLITAISGRVIYHCLLTIKDNPKRWRQAGVISTLAGFFITAAVEQLWWLAFIIPICSIAAYLFHLSPVKAEFQKTFLPGWVGHHPIYSLARAGSSLRTWLPTFYLLLLLSFAAVLIYTDTTAQRFLELTNRVEAGQELAVVRAIEPLRQADPGLPVYLIGQAYYQGKYIIDTLEISPCSQPPQKIASSEKVILEKAIRLYEQGLHPVKAHPIYWANLASLYWINQQPEAAQAALHQAIRLSGVNDSKIEIYLLNLGCYAELQQQTLAAMRAYAQLLQRNPQLIGSTFWSASEFREQHLEQIIKLAGQLWPTPQDQLLWAIELELARNNIAKAEFLIDTLARTFPDSPGALTWQARKLLNQQEYRQSQALASRTDDPQLLGEIALAAGELARARLYFKKAIFTNPNMPEPYFHLAQIALTEGKTEEAIHYLDKITVAFSPPATLDSKFIYGYPTNFSIYPALLILIPPPLQGQPFDTLAQLYQERGQPDLATEVDQARATYDAYAHY